MYSKQYLIFGSIILFGVGLLGLIGVLGPGANESLFGSAWFFGAGQSWVNMIFGVIAFILAYALDGETRRWTAGVYSVLAILNGAFALFLPASFSAMMGADSGSAISALFYLAFGAWGLWTAMGAMTTPTIHGPAPMARD